LNVNVNAMTFQIDRIPRAWGGESARFTSCRIARARLRLAKRFMFSLGSRQQQQCEQDAGERNQVPGICWHGGDPHAGMPFQSAYHLERGRIARIGCPRPRRAIGPRGLAEKNWH
jgi:hypothetical protein